MITIAIICLFIVTIINYIIVFSLAKTLSVLDRMEERWEREKEQNESSTHD